ncbi:Tryptophan--tRNA ligase, mitochondrial [Lobosporangium transversale]|nr:Tryptophan--tRNA ligase, mitochondrial [Lobosporangium transversale]
MSLRDPTKKMSKSDSSSQSRIHLVDSPAEISSKIKRAVTDSTRGISYDRLRRPAVANLIEIYATMKHISIEDVVQEHAESTTAVFKEALADVIISSLKPIQEEIALLEKDDGYIQSVLDQGAERASEIAQANLSEIQRLVGLL